MANRKETSLVIRKENVYEKIRKNLLILIFQKDYQMIQRLETLMKPRRPKPNAKIVIPKEIGKDTKKLWKT